MATLAPMLRANAARIHSDHQLLEHLLDQLDLALDRLTCYGEVFADFSAAGQVRRYGRQLTELLPEHCRREEVTLLEPVSDVSPELGEFCSRMKSEHADLLLKLAAFRTVLDEFDRANDLSEAIYHLKEQGKDLACDLRHHVRTEQCELSGFL